MTGWRRRGFRDHPYPSSSARSGAEPRPKSNLVHFTLNIYQIERFLWYLGAPKSRKWHICPILRFRRLYIRFIIFGRLICMFGGLAPCPPLYTPLFFVEDITSTPAAAAPSIRSVLQSENFQDFGHGGMKLWTNPWGPRLFLPFSFPIALPFPASSPPIP